MTEAIPHIDLKTAMVRNGLLLRDVAQEAEVNYSVASQLINGRRIDPHRLSLLRGAIRTLSAQAAASTKRTAKQKGRR